MFLIVCAAIEFEEIMMPFIRTQQHKNKSSAPHQSSSFYHIKKIEKSGGPVIYFVSPKKCPGTVLEFCANELPFFELAMNYVVTSHLLWTLVSEVNVGSIKVLNK